MIAGSYPAEVAGCPHDKGPEARSAAALAVERDRWVDLFLGATESSEVTTEIIRHQYLDMLRRCSFHTTIRITNRAMRILRAKRYSFAPGYVKA